jgi:hypothetical protein
MVTVRLKPQTVRLLKRRAKQLDYVDVSAFLRDFIESTATGDLAKVHAFTSRMIEKLAQEAARQAQMALPGLENGAKGKGGGR